MTEEVSLVTPKHSTSSEPSSLSGPASDADKNSSDFLGGQVDDGSAHVVDCSRDYLSVLPISWQEFKSTGRNIEDIRRIRSRLLRDDHHCSSKLNVLRRPEYKHRQLKSFRAAGLSVSSIYFPQEALKQTTVEPPVSYCANPSLISRVKNRSGVLNSADKEIREILENWLSVSSPGRCGSQSTIVDRRDWYFSSVTDCFSLVASTQVVDHIVDDSVKAVSSADSEDTRSLSPERGSDQDKYSVVSPSHDKPNDSEDDCIMFDEISESRRPNKSRTESDANSRTHEDFSAILASPSNKNLPVDPGCSLTLPAPSELHGDPFLVENSAFDDISGPKHSESGITSQTYDDGNEIVISSDCSPVLYDPGCPTSPHQCILSNPNSPHRGHSSIVIDSCPAKSQKPFNISLKASRSKLKPVLSLFSPDYEVCQDSENDVKTTNEVSNLSENERPTVNNSSDVCSRSPLVSTVSSETKNTSDVESDDNGRNTGEFECKVDSAQLVSPLPEIFEVPDTCRPSADDEIHPEVVSACASQSVTVTDSGFNSSDCHTPVISSSTKKDGMYVVSSSTLDSSSQPPKICSEISEKSVEVDRESVDESLSSTKCVKGMPFDSKTDSALNENLSRKRRRFTSGPVVTPAPDVKSSTLKSHTVTKNIENNMFPKKGFIVSEKVVDSFSPLIKNSSISIPENKVRKNKWDLKEKARLSDSPEVRNGATSMIDDRRGMKPQSSADVTHRLSTFGNAQQIFSSISVNSNESRCIKCPENSCVCCQERLINYDQVLRNEAREGVAGFSPRQSPNMKLSSHHVGKPFDIQESKAGDEITQSPESSYIVGNGSSLADNVSCRSLPSAKERENSLIVETSHVENVTNFPNIQKCGDNCHEHEFSRSLHREANNPESRSNNNDGELRDSTCLDNHVMKSCIERFTSDHDLMNPTHNRSSNFESRSGSLEQESVDCTCRGGERSSRVCKRSSCNEEHLAEERISGSKELISPTHQREPKYVESDSHSNDRNATNIEESCTGQDSRKYGQRSESGENNTTNPHGNRLDSTNYQTSCSEQWSPSCEHGSQDRNQESSHRSRRSSSENRSHRSRRSASNEDKCYRSGRRSSSNEDKSSVRGRRSRSREKRSSSRVRRSCSREKRSHSREKRSHSREKSSRSREKRSNSREKRSNNREKRSNSREKRSNSREKRSNSREKRSNSCEKRSNSREKRSNSREKRLRSRGKSSRSREKRSHSREKRSHSREKRYRNHGKRSRSREKRSYSREKRSRSRENSSLGRWKRSLSRERRSHIREKRPRSREKRARSHDRRSYSREKRSRSRERRSYSRGKRSRSRERRSYSRGKRSRSREKRPHSHQKRAHSREGRPYSREKRSCSREKRSRYRSKRSRSRSKRSRSRSKRSRSREKRSLSREKRSRSRSKRSRSREKRSRSRGRSYRNREKRSRSRERSCSRNKRSRSRERSCSRNKRSRSRERSCSRNKRSRSREKRSRSREKSSSPRPQISRRREKGSYSGERREHESHGCGSCFCVNDKFVGVCDHRPRCDSRSSCVCDRKTRIKDKCQSDFLLPTEISNYDSRRYKRRSSCSKYIDNSEQCEHKKEKEAQGSSMSKESPRSLLHQCRCSNCEVNSSPSKSDSKHHRGLNSLKNVVNLNSPHCDPSVSCKFGRTEHCSANSAALFNDKGRLVKCSENVSSTSHADSTISDSELQDNVLNNGGSCENTESLYSTMPTYNICPGYCPPLLSQPPSLAPPVSSLLGHSNLTSPDSTQTPNVQMVNPAGFAPFNFANNSLPPLIHPPPMIHPCNPPGLFYNQFPPTPFVGFMQPSVVTPTFPSIPSFHQTHMPPEPTPDVCLFPQSSVSPSTVSVLCDTTHPPPKTSPPVFSEKKRKFFFPVFNRMGSKRAKSMSVIVQSSRCTDEIVDGSETGESLLSTTGEFKDALVSSVCDKTEVSPLSPDVGDDDDELEEKAYTPVFPQIDATAARSILVVDGFMRGRTSKRVSFLDGYRPGEGSSSDEQDIGNTADSVTLSANDLPLLLPSRRSRGKRKNSRLKLQVRVIHQVSVTSTASSVRLCDDACDISQSRFDHSLRATPEDRVPDRTEHSLPATPENRVPDRTDHGLPATPEDGVPDRTEHSLPATPEDGVPDRTEHSLPAIPEDGAPDRTEHSLSAISEARVPDYHDGSLPATSESRVPDYHDDSLSATSEGRVIDQTDQSFPARPQQKVPNQTANSVPAAPGGIPPDRPFYYLGPAGMLLSYMRSIVLGSVADGQDSSDHLTADVDEVSCGSEDDPASTSAVSIAT